MKVSKVSIVEMILFAAGDEGLSLEQVAEVIDLNKKQTRVVMKELSASYDDVNRGIHLVEYAGVYKLATKREHADYIKKLVEAPSYKALSQSSLEILAIVAYKQPISRLEVEAIRGVKSDRALQKLLTKGLVKEVGRAETVGRAILYGTTKNFLDYFGLSTLKELPDLSLIVAEFSTDDDNDLFSYKYQEEVNEHDVTGKEEINEQMFAIEEPLPF